MLKEGKSPVFMSKSARKNKELVEQFEELKSSGRIDNYLKKKAKKNLHKDKKKMSHLQNWLGLSVTCIKSTHAISIHEKWKKYNNFVFQNSKWLYFRTTVCQT